MRKKNTQIKTIMGTLIKIIKIKIFPELHPQVSSALVVFRSSGGMFPRPPLGPPQAPRS